MHTPPDIRTNLDVFELDNSSDPIEVEVAFHDTPESSWASHLTLTVGKIDLSIFAPYSRNQATLRGLYEAVGAILQSLDGDSHDTKHRVISLAEAERMGLFTVNTRPDSDVAGASAVTAHAETCLSVVK